MALHCFKLREAVRVILIRSIIHVRALIYDPLGGRDSVSIRSSAVHTHGAPERTYVDGAACISYVSAAAI